MGTFYIQKCPFDREPRHEYWDRDKQVSMARQRSPGNGLFDVGTFYIQKRPFDREPKHEYWDRHE